MAMIAITTSSSIRVNAKARVLREASGVFMRSISPRFRFAKPTRRGPASAFVFGGNNIGEAGSCRVPNCGSARSFGLPGPDLHVVNRGVFSFTGNRFKADFIAGAQRNPRDRAPGRGMGIGPRRRQGVVRRPGIDRLPGDFQGESGNAVLLIEIFHSQVIPSGLAVEDETGGAAPNRRRQLNGAFA